MVDAGSVMKSRSQHMKKWVVLSVEGDEAEVKRFETLIEGFNAPQPGHARVGMVACELDSASQMLPPNPTFVAAANGSVARLPEPGE